MMVMEKNGLGWPRALGRRRQSDGVWKWSIMALQLSVAPRTWRSLRQQLELSCVWDTPEGHLLPIIQHSPMRPKLI
jgi:hypothetical protein